MVSGNDLDLTFIQYKKSHFKFKTLGFETIQVLHAGTSLIGNFTCYFMWYQCHKGNFQTPCRYALMTPPSICISSYFLQIESSLHHVAGEK